MSDDTKKRTDGGESPSVPAIPVVELIDDQFMSSEALRQFATRPFVPDDEEHKPS